MKNIPPLYPVLFATNPVLLLLSGNISDFALAQAFPMIFIIPTLAGIAILLYYHLLKDAHRAGFIVFLSIFWFFHFGTIRLVAGSINIAGIQIAQTWFFFIIWTLLFGFLGSSIVWHKVTSPQTITNYLSLVCVIIFLVSIGRMAIDLAPRYFQKPDASAIISTLPPTAALNPFPDIYYIILDGYCNAEILQQVYDYNNTAFLEDLRTRGFYIAPQSHSNYPQTALSLASSLNMQYLTDLPSTAPDRGQLISMINHSRLRTVLEHIGYQTITFESGYLPTTITDVDFFLTSPDLRHNRDLEAYLWLNSAAVLLMENGLLDIPITTFRTQQERVIFTFESLSNLPETSGPKFVFAHIIAPHPPFIFDANGPITPENTYILADGNRLPGSQADYIRGYIAQLVYINQHMIETVDAILATASVLPIIVIQGDHGPGAYFHFDSAEETCMSERFSILNAYYIPEGIYIPGDITPVNTFRLILNTYFGSNLDLLENNSYYSTWDKPFQFIDVTAKLGTTCETP